MKSLLSPRLEGKVLERLPRDGIFHCLWKDGSTTWAPLKDIEESNPADIAEYVVAKRISEEAAFAWWLRHTLKK